MTTTIRIRVRPDALLSDWMQLVSSILSIDPGARATIKNESIYVTIQDEAQSKVDAYAAGLLHIAVIETSDVPDMWHNRNVAYYQLNEPSGTIAHDSSGNDYHATLRVDDAPTNVALGDTDAQ